MDYGPGDRRRRAAGGDARRARRRRIPRRRRRMSLLEIEHLDLRHGLLEAVRDCLARGRARARPSRWSARTAPARRRCCARSPEPTGPAPGTIIFDGATSRGCGAHRRVQMGIALVPEGRRLFAGADGRGEPARRRAAHAPRPLDRRDGDRGVPDARPPAPSAGRDALGRRAAGDRDRARADRQSAPAAARRGLARASRRWPSTPSTRSLATRDRRGRDDRSSSSRT